MTTRCGGHSASASFLRDGGMLIDVSRLNGLEIDAKNMQIIAGPGVIAREFNARLAQAGLAFPTAHCGMVPLGGFLLGGGLGLKRQRLGRDECLQHSGRRGCSLRMERSGRRARAKTPICSGRFGAADLACFAS